MPHPQLSHFTYGPLWREIYPKWYSIEPSQLNFFSPFLHFSVGRVNIGTRLSNFIFSDNIHNVLNIILFYISTVRPPQPNLGCSNWIKCKDNDFFALFSSMHKRGANIETIQKWMDNQACIQAVWNTIIFFKEQLTPNPQYYVTPIVLR